MVSSTKNSNEEFRRHAPAPLSPRPLNLPTPREATLANGLQIVVVEDHRLPLVSLRLGFHEGSVNDPQGRPGLTAFMTGLLTEGTKTRKSRQIADESASIGATISAGANSDYLTVAASALSEYTSNIFELLADVTLNPSFPEEELALAKENTKQALIQQRAQPSFLASEQTARVLFGEHPYSVVSPTPESVDATAREELLQYHRRAFLPNRAVLIAVGDVKFEQVRSEAEKLFGDWQAGESTGSRFPDPPVATERRAFIVDRPGSEQSNIVIANHAIKRTDPDFFPMLLLHTVLGANASSRLFMNLREEKGYTYGAYSSLDARTYGGTFRASSEVRTSVTGPALDEFFYELERIRDEDVTDKELADAKAYLTGVFPIRLETQEGLTDQLVQMKMLGLPNDYLHTYRQNIDSVTVADIRGVANKYITPSVAAIVIVGDSQKIAEEVGRFAENVEVFDSSGRRKNDKPADSDSGSGANLTGSWNLQLQLPTGQTVPATLRVEHSESGLTGAVQSQFGDADLSNIAVDGQNLQATVSLAIMGRKMDGDVGFFVEGDHVKGSINIPGLPQIHFEGSRGE